MRASTGQCGPLPPVPTTSWWSSLRMAFSCRTGASRRCAGGPAWARTRANRTTLAANIGTTLGALAEDIGTKCATIQKLPSPVFKPNHLCTKAQFNVYILRVNILYTCNYRIWLMATKLATWFHIPSVSYAFLIYLYIFDTSVPPLYVFLPKIMPRSQINTDYDDEEVRYYIESRYGTDSQYFYGPPSWIFLKNFKNIKSNYRGGPREGGRGHCINHCRQDPGNYELRTYQTLIKNCGPISL